jgi:hypothetical protein
MHCRRSHQLDSYFARIRVAGAAFETPCPRIARRDRNVGSTLPEGVRVKTGPSQNGRADTTPGDSGCEEKPGRLTRLRVCGFTSHSDIESFNEVFGGSSAMRLDILLTRHSPYRSDKLSRLAAPSELTPASLALWNQEFSGIQAHGAHIAITIGCGTAREGLSLIVGMLFNRGPKSICHPRGGESDAA